MSQLDPNTSSFRYIPKPQKRFRFPIDNSLNHFVPNITVKPNALVPLDVGPICTRKGKIIQSFRHPYAFEIDDFILNEWQCSFTEAIRPKSLDETDLVFVDTIDRLRQLIDELKAEREIAVDIEGHGRRSFLGLTCILQLSTRTCDCIIDSLELRDDLHLLNEIFTDPKILKVFHGSSNDVTCLQRDFAIFIVNMFDTLEATRYLKLDTESLQSLAKCFCNIGLDKRLRSRTDWRIRPLSSEHISYARQDTHYLLYIYDILRNRLIERSQEELRIVYGTSRNNCKLIYTKPKQMNEIAFCKRFEKTLNDQQMRVLRALLIWRDTYAREKDESLDYVLPVATMLELAKHLPKSIDQLLKCCGKFVPCTVQKSKESLVRIILEAL